MNIIGEGRKFWKRGRSPRVLSPTQFVCVTCGAKAQSGGVDRDTKRFSYRHGATITQNKADIPHGWPSAASCSGKCQNVAAVIAAKGDRMMRKTTLIIRGVDIDLLKTQVASLEELIDIFTKDQNPGDKDFLDALEGILNMIGDREEVPSDSNI